MNRHYTAERLQIAFIIGKLTFLLAVFRLQQPFDVRLKHKHNMKITDTTTAMLAAININKFICNTFPNIFMSNCVSYK